MDWFLYNRDFRHETVKESDYANSLLISSFFLKFSRKNVFEENCGLKKLLYRNQRQSQNPVKHH